MKKFLFTASMLVCFSALSQAQQGRVGINTTTPAATLDVVANTTDPARPDALLVPRMTRAQLEAKDLAYTPLQNGALAFVSSVADGTGTGKTANVTATGFYYYDAPNSVWVAVGGGGSATPPQRYEGIRGNTKTITAANYDIAADDYYIITNAGVGVTINFPNLTAADAGRVVYVFNNNTAALGNNITNVAGIVTMTQFRGYPIVWSGTGWFALTK
ncbi:hypothetical protein [Chryseobacterium sp. FH2]|uniref:hypothetical protein n=1 Tax=Chryseobacterium sp. FH2 TaxID=1674291 RepID=UPI00065AD511|nr:hypothetical protein [Chryseobacterium sp. FH2]